MHPIRTLRTFALIAAVAVAFGACQQATEDGGVEGATASPRMPGDSPAPMSPGLESPATSPDASPPTASPSANQLFPIFEARAGSTLTGGAIVTDVDGEVSIVVGVVAPDAAEMLPIAIAEGDCATQPDQGPIPPPEQFATPDPDASPVPVATPDASPGVGASPGASPGAPGALELPYWLMPVMVGSSNSVVPTTVDELTAAPHSLIIETSPDDPTIIACADLVEGPDPLEQPGAGGGQPGTAPAASPGAGQPGASPATSP